MGDIDRGREHVRFTLAEWRNKHFRMTEEFYHLFTYIIAIDNAARLSFPCPFGYGEGCYSVCGGEPCPNTNICKALSGLGLISQEELDAIAKKDEYGGKE